MDMFERPLLIRHMGDMIDGDWLWGQLYNDNYRNFIFSTFFSRGEINDDIYLSSYEREDISELREIFSDFTNIARVKYSKRLRKTLKQLTGDNLVQDKILGFLI